MSVDLVSAARGLLNAGFPTETALPTTDPAAIRFYDTRVVNERDGDGNPLPPPNRYAILTGGTGAYYSETYGGDFELPNVRLRATIVALLPRDSTGTPGPMARWLATKVDSVLVGARPVIDGRTVSRIRHIATDFQGSDEQITDRLSAYYVGDYAVSVT